MTIRLNGETRTFEDVRTIADLVSHLDLPAATLLVEHNGSALRPAEWDGAGLTEGDQIEVLRIAAGG
ncbi:MAG: sulfur carrier protein ThiS [Chthoniobacteraceae bacterium]